MPKWTMDKELEDTAKAASSGFEMADKAADRAKKKEGMDTGGYKRGGYVGARASGKRMYAKGGMVKGKCGG